MTDKINDRLRTSAARYYRDTLGLPDWAARAQGRLERGYEQYMFERLCQLVGPLAGKTFLDLGCGWGGVVPAAAAVARQAVGLEPDEERLAIARDIIGGSRSTQARVMQGAGESLPFDDNSFDVVASYQVLEHVRDPAKVIAEVGRVLKPGGVFHFSTPNYLAFWEPHYKMFWLPLMPKSLGRRYLKWCGRKTAFLAHIHYLTPLNVRRFLRQARLEFVDLHYEQALRKLRRRLDSWFGRQAGDTWVGKLVHRICARALFVVHTCLVNRDQEYLATKP